MQRGHLAVCVDTQCCASVFILTYICLFYVCSIETVLLCSLENQICFLNDHFVLVI